MENPTAEIAPPPPVDTPEGASVSADPFADTAAPPAPRKRGRPPKSAAEKAVTQLDHALRVAAGAGVPTEILAKYQAAATDAKSALATAPKAAPVKAAPTPVAPLAPVEAPRKPPTREQREKLNRALTKTFNFLGEAVYEVACEGTAPPFPESRAKDLADAWEDIIAEYLPENGASVLGWGIAIASTGQVVVQSAREVKAHNEKKNAGA